MKRYGSSLILLTGVLIVILNPASHTSQVSAQDGPFRVAWSDLEPITPDNFGDLTKIYSVNLGEGTVSIGDSFYAHGQLLVALTLFYKPQREITETVYLLQATETDVEITPLKDLTDSLVTDIDFSNTGEYMSLATFETVEVWNVNTQEQTRIIDQQDIISLGLRGAMYSADFHPITDHLITTNADGFIEWNTTLESPVKVWNQPGFFVLDIDFAPSGDIMAIGYMGGVILTDPDKPDDMVALVSGEANRNVLFNANGSVLGYISDGGFEVGLWNMATSEDTIIIQPGYEAIGNDIGFNGDGRLFMIATPDGLQFYGAITSDYLGKLDDYSNEILSLSASNEGRFLITGHENGELIIWGVPKQQE